MKVQIVSDLHLEFNTDLTVENAGADVLILSGDICVAEHLYRNPLFITKPDGSLVDTSTMINNGWYADDARRYREFFNKVSNEFDVVFYVMGNHEHYHGRWDRTASILREALEPFSNIHLLDNEWINFNGVRFAGTTLWTDLNKRDPITMHAVRDMMYDYRAITLKSTAANGSFHKLRPIDTVQAHEKALQFLKVAYETWQGPMVVVGHHCPTMLSCHETYRNEYIMNGAFYSDLFEFIAERDRIKLWTHGHTHRAFDYIAGETRVICNPHGYPGEIREYNPALVVEI